MRLPSTAAHSGQAREDGQAASHRGLRIKEEGPQVHPVLLLASACTLFFGQLPCGLFVLYSDVVPSEAFPRKCPHI